MGRRVAAAALTLCIGLAFAGETGAKAPARPNLRIGHTHLVLANGKITGTVAIRNSGKAAAGAEAVGISYRLRARTKRRRLQTITVAALKRGHRAVYRISAPFGNNHGIGFYVIEACADVHHVVAESSEADNCKHLAVLQIPATVPQGDVSKPDDDADQPDEPNDDVQDDTTPPDTVIDSSPTGAVRDNPPPSFVFHSTEADGVFECRFDGGAWGTCSSPASAPVLGPGSHTFEVRAYDATGNVDPTPASATWTTIDTTPPDTFIDSGPSGQVSANQADVAFHSSDPGSTFVCSLDSQVGGPTPCTSPVHLDALANGKHHFEVTATDPAGNRDPSPAFVEWQVG